MWSNFFLITKGVVNNNDAIIIAQSHIILGLHGVFIEKYLKP